MKVPPIKSGNYQAAAVMTLSELLLKRKVSIFLVGKAGKGQYKSVGISDSIQKDLSALFIDKTKKKLFLSVQNNSGTKYGNCQIALTSPDSLDQSLVSSRASVRG